MTHFSFLQLVVALSAYISAVRLAVISRLTSANPPSNPESAKWFLVLLIPADAPLVVAGILLALDVFWLDMFQSSTPAALYTVAVWCFMFAVVVLAIHHLVAWINSLVNHSPW
ncbi:MAG TPA: hypothetical protein VHD56_11350 [Tepidisphaeraceae bacterium]|nr:hypothetical protein [Tepidisphaeraceae bacterium]